MVTLDADDLVIAVIVGIELQRIERQALALAIGLCTVVQNEQRGVNLEAMFIDEGFGSLDQGTLDYYPFVGVGFSLMAVQYTGAGIASTLMALTPIIIILPSYWLFRQPVTWRSVAGALISVLGVSLFFLSE